jgi:uncharacterized membrane protein
VIWAIGLSMLALSVLVWLPRKALLLLGLVLVAGHNLFDSLHFPPDHVMHIPGQSCMTVVGWSWRACNCARPILCCPGLA